MPTDYTVVGQLLYVSQRVLQAVHRVPWISQDNLNLLSYHTASSGYKANASCWSISYACHVQLTLSLLYLSLNSFVRTDSSPGPFLGCFGATYFMLKRMPSLTLVNL